MNAPSPTSPTIQPVGVMLASALTAIAIDKYADGDTTKKLSAALTAQTVASILTVGATGDIVGALGLLKTLVGNVTDPGLGVVVNQLVAIGTTFLQGETVAIQAIPLLSDEIDGWMANTAQGMNAVAQADITAYSPKSKA